MRIPEMGWGGLCLLALLAACKPEQSARSPLFWQVFRDDTSMFRGIALGEPVDFVLRQEAPANPLHQDQIGLSFAHNLPDSGLLIVDYYSDYLREERGKERLASIAADVILRDEVETARLYDELRLYFSQRYGIPDGGFGHFIWRGNSRLTPSMEISLQLVSSKKITLNFVDTYHGDPASLSAQDSLLIPSVQ